ncbi:hypothetical protein [Spiroplasma floricola]|uniref:Lipoprotein n=1 Tax=Spiroplasma floricola 23-6 TaxID=1336749 RepID=A0A2K8SER1_9MOLU|nr:hypothetical protein [Spiroplasma floricola]AUB31912.1 hypothetical protein SFLOR_v1c08640 [Spiroplasma floricola 23-6]
MITIKKLLSVLASLQVITLTSSTVVACTGPHYSLNYSKDSGKLQQTIKIDNEKLKEFDNTTTLVNYIQKQTKDLNKKPYQVTINVKNSSKNEVKEEDYDKSKEMRFVIVYLKAFLETEDEKQWEEVSSLAENASFALLNK